MSVRTASISFRTNDFATNFDGTGSGFEGVKLERGWGGANWQGDADFAGRRKGVLEWVWGLWQNARAYGDGLHVLLAPWHWRVDHNPRAASFG